jgi:ribonuclease G
MSKELIVSAGRHETRVAILEDDQLVEVFHEREKEYSLAGSIQKGRVTRVLPGMQSAFVDIGLERDAFLYVSDFFEDNEEYDAVVSTVEDKVLKMEKSAVAREAAPPAREAPPEEPQEKTEPEAAMAETLGPVLVSPAPASERREEFKHDGRQDRQGGRRGRRRRGGRGSGGLPESKFFSPRTEQENAPEVVNKAEVTAPEPWPKAPSSESEGGRDFTVLPGESLAKYTAPEHHEYDEQDVREQDLREQDLREQDLRDRGLRHELRRDQVTPEPENGTEPDWPPVEEPQSFEPALPDEHPLAGLTAASSWASEPAYEAGASEKRKVEIAPAPEPAEETAPAAPEAAGASEGVSAEPPEPEARMAGAAEDTEESEESEDFADAIAEARHESAAEPGSPIVLEPGSTQDASAESEAQGPEPARIPTSLTAALREQGHRYPHRVSRRMRRRMRSQQPGDERRPQQTAGDTTPSTLPEEASPETGPVEVELVRNVETRDVSRPDARQERGGRERDRSERDRSDRERDRSGRAAQDRSAADRAERAEKPDRDRPPLPSISDLLKEGQEIIVQIAKEPLGQKGARITSHIALPGRFVVYMPTVDHAGVSRKIPSDEERQRLKRILQTHRQGVSGGFICRTAAEGKSEEELKSDMHFLYNLWLDMRQKAEKRPAPVLLHHDLDLVQRILRDQLTSSFKTIWVDNEELYESVLRFAERFQPALLGRIKLYTRSNPIFDEFGITNELEKALRPKVWLKSGGYIVINQTEALVAIDINTGKYVGKSNRLEDTIVKVNTDAIKEIVRQIRVRDLGGIIVVDFIDMDERRNRQKVMQVLEETMRSDRAPYKILQFNDFGLVAITRKRVKQSLERTLCSPCPYCDGAGYVKSVQTVIGEILQEAQRTRKALATESTNVVLRVNPEVARVLKSNQNQFLQEIEEIVGRSVLVKSDPLLHQTKFDLA